MPKIRFLCLVAVSTVSMTAAAADFGLPRCRLDVTHGAKVSRTIETASAAYDTMGKRLGFEKVLVNPEKPSKDLAILDVYIVKDAGKSGASKDRCATSTAKPGEELDDISVRGGCVVTAIRHREVRCSAQAVEIFGGTQGQDARLAPPLLYVLAHELGHLHQKRIGEYGGRLEQIDLSKPTSEKLTQLRESCEPANVSVEASADALAVEVLKRLLPKPPYREPAFSEQGSVYWAVDQLNLAANRWQKTAMEREFLSQPKPHPSFFQTEFPTAPSEIAARAKTFVCDALSKEAGRFGFPLRAIDHPPLEQRMRLVAEALRPIAAALPATDGQQQFKSIAVLQEGVSPILNQIYRETGVFMEGMRREVCTRVNSDAPTRGCE